MSGAVWEMKMFTAAKERRNITLHYIVSATVVRNTGKYMLTSAAPFPPSKFSCIQHFYVDYSIETTFRNSLVDKMLIVLRNCIEVFG